MQAMCKDLVIVHREPAQFVIHGVPKNPKGWLQSLKRSSDAKKKKKKKKKKDFEPPKKKIKNEL